MKLAEEALWAACMSTSSSHTVGNYFPLLRALTENTLCKISSLALRRLAIMLTVMLANLSRPVWHGVKI